MLYDGTETVSHPAQPSEPREFSIGGLSQATGVPVDTLRTWERRYGFPAPLARSEGSHRRYSAETITTVQLIVRALERGHRPSAIVGRSPEQLRQLLEAAGPPLEPEAKEAQRIEDWLQLTREMDGDTLTGEFQRCLAELPALDFLERCMGPYLVELGARWERGEVQIFEEHLASERAREFLSGQWRRLTESARSPARPLVILATPTGEHHVLGLHMAAWVVALAGVHIEFLGADTPLSEVALAVARYDAQGVVLSVAAGYARNLPAELLDLRGQLSPRVSIVIGGAGSRDLDLAARRLNGFAELSTWSEHLPLRQ
jgi:DNA-binding transcriptional MerR regulator/methylmalonyl-CoA mutase cobalamin-binding subunit